LSSYLSTSPLSPVQNPPASPRNDYTKPIAIEPNPTIFLSAGEASGDAYGAALIDRLRSTLPTASFIGLGGLQMERAGQHRTVRAEDVAHMGITEVLRHAPYIYRQYRKLVAVIQRQKPDIAVLIDFPDVNFRLAKHLSRAGVPVIWFVSPQLWAWKRARLRWVQERVTKMLVIFPFEERFYRERGVDAEFVGHPLAVQPHTDNTLTKRRHPAAKDFDAIIDTLPSNAQGDSGTISTIIRPPDTGNGDGGLSASALAPQPGTTRDQYAAQHHLDPTRTWIALLPGSRWKEIRANLPALHELAMSDLTGTAAALTTFDAVGLHPPTDPAAHTRYEFLLPVASTIDTNELRRYIATLNAEHLKYFGPEAASLRLTLVPDAREALALARASVVASGTATVLAAVVGNPFVVVYRVSPLTFALAKRLVKYPEEFPRMLDADGNLPVAMVNLIAGKRIVPELLQERFTAANVANALGPLLAEGDAREAQIAALARVRERLLATTSTAASPIDRVAEAVLDLLA
jgi:lipid-A-disaccharide synthase